MKTNEQKELILPVYVAGKRACLSGKAISGVKFPRELVENIKTKKDTPKDWTYVQFWVGRSGFIRSLIKGKTPKRFLMAKFYLAEKDKTKSMYCKEAWLKGQALQYVKAYWDEQSQ